MTLSGRVKRMRIYIGEELSYGDLPLYRAILERARHFDIAGCTVFKGIEGYGANARKIRSDKRFIYMSTDLPIVVELIDSIANLLKLKDFLQENVQKGLVTVEDTYVAGYGTDFNMYQYTQEEVTELIKEAIAKEKREKDRVDKLAKKLVNEKKEENDDE